MDGMDSNQSESNFIDFQLSFITLKQYKVRTAKKKWLIFMN